MSFASSRYSRGTFFISATFSTHPYAINLSTLITDLGTAQSGAYTATEYDKFPEFSQFIYLSCIIILQINLTFSLSSSHVMADLPIKSVRVLTFSHSTREIQ